jgi:oligosaccharide repeat unit polymerase
MTTSNQFGRGRKIVHTLVWIAVGVCLAAILRSQPPDRTSVILAGAAYGAALLYTRYVLQIRFLQVPSLWLMALAVFHLGLVVPWALGLYDATDNWWMAHEDIPSAMLLISLALISYQIGIIASLRQPGPERGTIGEKRTAPTLANRGLFISGLILMGVAGLMYISGFRAAFGSHFSGVAYSDMYEQVMEVDSRWYGAGLILFPVGVYIAAAGATRRQLRVLFACVGLWAAWQLFLGFRSRALLILIVALYMAVKKGFRVPKQALVICAISILYIVPVVSLVRQEAVGRRFSEKTWHEANPLGGVAEMGQAIWPVAETYRLIGPNQLRLGRTYLSSLSRVIPSIGVGYAPSKRLREINLDNSPAYWFLLVTAPYLFRLNQGRGFSVVAEAYMNFGTWGVVIIFFALGCVLVRLEALSTRNPFSLAAIAIVLDPLLWVVRNDSSVFTRTAVWGCSYLFFAWLFASGLISAPKRPERSAVGKALPSRPSLRPEGY